MGYLEHIKACNNFDSSAFRPFEIAGRRVGWVRHGNAAHLEQFRHIFDVSERSISLAPDLNDFDARSAAMSLVVSTLSKGGVLPRPRDEPYSVAYDHNVPPLMRIERTACPFFGISASGVHMNGYVCHGGGLHMWVARRARDKGTYPGMLDNMVAGGQPHGLGLKENMIKECGEEAGIPPSIAARARPVGLIVYHHQSEDGAKPDRQYCFDLELPADFKPVAMDGEVDEFMLWPIEQVVAKVRDTFEFKFNCNLVIIDFLIRHGVLDPDNEPDYAALCQGLHKSDVF
tara:strand:- start:1942 stop:2802 length:861 start_codon:yes stop_codon:yes gene_type:complete